MKLSKPLHFVDNDGKAHTFYCRLGKYKDGTLAITLVEYLGEDYPEPYMNLTVNLDGWTGRKTQSDTRAYVNINDYGFGVLRFIRETGIGKPTGITCASGFLQYPLYEFDLEKI